MHHYFLNPYIPHPSFAHTVYILPRSSIDKVSVVYQNDIFISTSQYPIQRSLLPPYCKHSPCIKLFFMLSSTPMKGMFFILSLFMLCMSCMPCGDNTDCNEQAPTTITAANDHQQHNHEAETCSPFCSCACCAASVYQTAFFKIPTPKISFRAEKYAFYQTAFTNELSCSIWQPPQLS